MTADDARVEGVRIRDALFGILAERARGLVIRGNEITGDPARAARPARRRHPALGGARQPSSRTTSSRDGRDLVVWYSPGNRFERNHVERGRYGLHFMYSHDNHVADNGFADDVVGIFVMYSHRVSARGRTDSCAPAGRPASASASRSPATSSMRGNTFVGQHAPACSSTPMRSIPTERNRFEGNEFRFHDRRPALPRRASSATSSRGNRFRDNRVSVAVEGAGDARAALWRGNDFDDYAGYDLDGDGVGDMPVRADAASPSDWIARIPALGFFRGSLALGAVEWLGRALPLFRPAARARRPRAAAAPRLARSGPWRLRRAGYGSASAASRRCAG